MSDPDLSKTIGSWLDFSDNLRVQALHLLNEPTIELGDKGLAQPRVFAAALAGSHDYQPQGGPRAASGRVDYGSADSYAFMP